MPETKREREEGQLRDRDRLVGIAHEARDGEAERGQCGRSERQGDERGRQHAPVDLHPEGLDRDHMEHAGCDSRPTGPS